MTIKNIRTRPFLKKPCKKCGVVFLPDSHGNLICEDCYKKTYLLLRLERVKDSVEGAIKKSNKYNEKIWYKDLLKIQEILEKITKNLAGEMKNN